MDININNKIPSETISSLEIAEITGTRHSNVMSKIRHLSSKGCLTGNVEKSKYKSYRNKMEPLFILTNIQYQEVLSTYRVVSGGFQAKATVRVEFVFGREIVENMFSQYKILPQHRVCNDKYNIDWYIPELNIAIEFDEAYHKQPKQIKKDQKRQAEIELELGCKFLRYKQ